MSVEPSGNGFRNRLPWIIAGIAVLALAVSLVRGQKDDGDQATIAQLTERLDALETSNAGAVDGTRRGGGTSFAGQGGSGAAAGGGARDFAQEPQTPAEIAAARERQLRELEAQFARDVADPATGPATESVLVDTISGPTMAGTGLRPDNVDIACKQSSCRIVGSFDRMGDAQDWSLFYITAAGGNVLTQTQMVFVPRPDGKTEVRIYSNRARD